MVVAARLGFVAESGTERLGGPGTKCLGGSAGHHSLKGLRGQGAKGRGTIENLRIFFEEGEGGEGAREREVERERSIERGRGRMEGGC